MREINDRLYGFIRVSGREACHCSSVEASWELKLLKVDKVIKHVKKPKCFIFSQQTFT